MKTTDSRRETRSRNAKQPEPRGVTPAWRWLDRDATMNPARLVQR